MVFALLVSVITSARIAGAIKANSITKFIIARSHRLVIASTTAQTFFSMIVYS